MKAIILAAGLGTRLGEKPQNFPKCLLKIGNLTILERQIKILKESDISEISLVIGTKGDCWIQENYKRIREIHKDIIYNFDNLKTQNTYSLYLGLEKIDNGPVLAIDGDLVFERRMIKEVIENKCDTLIVSKIAEDRGEPGTKVVTDNNRKIIDIGKTITPKDFPWGIHSGLIKIGEKTYKSFKEEVGKGKYRENDLGYPLRELCKKYEIYSIILDARWINVNTSEDYQIARRIFGEGK